MVARSAPPAKHAKRADLQGIRAVAIIGVLLFHLRPRDFAAGFLGVDVFFVLSGFLMSSILAREDSITLGIMAQFYIRRFKRIVPLYALLLVVLLIFVPLIFLSRDVKRFLSDLAVAAAFGTNIAAVVERVDYWSEVFDSNVLTHTWSLGVEIQFYLVVPLIIALQRAFGPRWSIPYLFVISAVSLFAYLVASPMAAFNLPSSRVWQFLAGGLAFEWSRSDSEEVTDSEGRKYKILATTPCLDHELDDAIAFEDSRGPGKCSKLLSHCLVLILVALLIGPSTAFLSTNALRVTTITLTALLIAIGSEESHQSAIIMNAPMVYIGDISYVVYLAHWPVITMWKSYADVTELGAVECIACAAVTLLISVFLHHTVEAYFISSSTSTAAVFVALVYAAMALSAIFHLPESVVVWREAKSLGFAMPDGQPNITEAIKWNEKVAKTAYYNRRPFKDCKDDLEVTNWTRAHDSKKPYECVARGPGNLSVLIVGNSIAHRSSMILSKILHGRYSTFRLFAHSACNPISDLNPCRDFFNASFAVAQHQRPDVTFFIVSDNPTIDAPILDLQTDVTVQKLRSVLETFRKYSGTVVYDEEYPRPAKSVGVAMSMVKRLRRGQSLDGLKIDHLSWLEQKANYWKRVGSIPWDSRLIRHNTSGSICGREDPGTCWLYNRTSLHAYLADNSHLSSEGLNLLRPSYTAILHRLFPSVI